MRIAVLNVGSSSVKAAGFEGEAESLRETERVDRDVPSGEGGTEAAVRDALAAVGVGSREVDALGHRVVHGGTRFTTPTRIDTEVEAAIEALCALAPLHNPAALAGLRAARELAPNVPMVAVFDTAFHAARPAASTRYALPWELADSLELYRYGFHGIAHASLAASLAQAEGIDPHEVTAVTLQLGAGCSAAAIERGRSIETSMGFTPLEGLPMATRSGDVDPALVLHLLRQGYDADALEALLMRRSGLLGLGGSADLREVLAAEAQGKERARVAVELLVQRVVATTGAYLTLLAGQGSVAFGGGIGTHSAEIRERVAHGLRGWDVRLDPSHGPEARGRISAPGTRPVFAFATDEESVIARATAEALGAQAA